MKKEIGELADRVKEDFYRLQYLYSSDTRRLYFASLQDAITNLNRPAGHVRMPALVIFE